jgi:hypothetical protein
MAVNSEFPQDVIIEDLITITPVTHCKYLGVNISNDEGWNMEIKKRIKEMESEWLVA